MRNLYPRESVEFQPVSVSVNGTAVTTNVEFAITERDGRPATWGSAVSLSGSIGVMVEALDPGDYTVWAKVTSLPEVPVIDCGFFTIT
jgi:hypothetical protein